ncbi:conserved hypothetical protein [Candidatus Roizmanbacteria bacterium]|nr:conserved hypothetical protein [Candidatus Roizmanbacteria bacterium]
MLSTYNTILTKKTQLNSNTYLYHFDLLEPKEIIFIPGQYVMLKVPSDKGPVSRLYSIASSNNSKTSFELIIEIVPGGLASNYLFSMSEKTEVVFQGPAGMFSLRENVKEKVFLITGTGIAPVRSMLNSIIKNKKAYLFWGLKSFKDVYLLNELREISMVGVNIKICLSREQNLEVVPSADRSFFDLGHVDSCFIKQFNNLTVEQINNLEFYLCGGRLVVEALRQFLQVKNVLQENIFFEKF